MIKIIGIIIVVAIAVILIFAAMQPNSFRVQRSTTIKAPPEKVFAAIDDFHRWEAWSPWEKIDPASSAVIAGLAMAKVPCIRGKAIMTLGKAAWKLSSRHHRQS